MVNKELEKLVNISRMLTETEVTNKLIDIIINLSNCKQVLTFKV